MKIIFTVVLFFNIAVSAQNSDKILVSDPISTGLGSSPNYQSTSTNSLRVLNASDYFKTDNIWNSSENSTIDPSTLIYRINTLDSANTTSSLYFTNTSESDDNISKTRIFLSASEFTDEDNVLSSSEYPFLFTSIGTPAIGSLNKIRTIASEGLTISDVSSFPVVTLYAATDIIRINPENNDITGLHSIQLSSIGGDIFVFGTPHNIDTSLYYFASATFSRFSDISVANYKSLKEISSFDFSDHVLSDDKGVDFPLRTTSVSSSITASLSAQPGNGAIVTERGIYQSLWKGSDNTAYADLKAPSPYEQVSFTLHSTANVSYNNRTGSFTINTGDNALSFATLNSTEGQIGWENTVDSKLNLRAAIIDANGLLSTDRLVVYEGDIDQLSGYGNSVAYFASDNPDGTEVIVDNLNSLPGSFAGVTFNQGNVSSRIASYSVNENSSSYLSGSFAIESNNPEGILISVTSNTDSESSPIRFLFDSQEVVRITAGSILLGTTVESPSSMFTMESHTKGILLRGITDDEMFGIEDPEPGVTIFNKQRKAFCLYDGEIWKQVLSKPIKSRKKQSSTKI